MGEINDFVKSCPKCGVKRVFSHRSSLYYAIKTNSVCGNCSRSHEKRQLEGEILETVIKLYNNGNSITKISLIVKTSKKIVRRTLLNQNILIQGRDDVKKEFTQSEINEIRRLYLEEKLSCEKIGKFFNN